MNSHDPAYAFTQIYPLDGSNKLQVSLQNPSLNLFKNPSAKLYD